ncbi:DcaP family trimeric outer membrane transporter [Halomonas sp. HK25]|uniref:DcaP family trimeric outer membrane transporter n=1 Tax=Halomonas sp. HK25 TaxID=3394321 RepID=UPI0039FCB3BA
MNHLTTTRRLTALAGGLMGLAAAGSASALEFSVGDTTLGVYGYAKLDIIYDVDDDLGISVNHLAISRDDERSSTGHSTLHAYESRLGFSTSTPLEGSVLNTRIEGDFYGGGGGQFRLRHAYGEWNGILAGQTWTNFHGFVAATPTVSFTGLGGMPNTSRQAQLRYTQGNFSVALEDPDKLGGREETFGLGADKSRLPDLTLRYTRRADDFAVSTSAVLRHLEYDAIDQDDSTLGWGVALEGALNVSEAVTLRAGVTHGDGIGSYLNENPTSTPAIDAAPAYVGADGRLRTVESTGGTLGMTVKVGPGSINAAYYRTVTDLDDSPYPGETSDRRESFFLNYIWSPVERVSYGLEAGWHARETLDGREGEAVRLQGMVKYSF